MTDTKTKIGQAGMSGALAVAVGIPVMYIISGGRYPSKESIKYAIPASFVSGVLLYTAFEVTGIHKSFCESLLK